jgi:preprotein translocase subunit SecD|tara:strand:- start:528 stop:695 length:168 start_codon:yes stop_codon:yes gene_type:complete
MQSGKEENCSEKIKGFAHEFGLLGVVIGVFLTRTFYAPLLKLYRAKIVLNIYYLN